MRIGSKSFFFLFIISILTVTAYSMAFNPIANIVISSIGFFNPLIRLIKSFYSNSKNSSANLRYDSLIHAEYTHLQAASDKEIESLIDNGHRKRTKNKLIFFSEEIENTEQVDTTHFNSNALNDKIQKNESLIESYIGEIVLGPEVKNLTEILCDLQNVNELNDFNTKNFSANLTIEPYSIINATEISKLAPTNSFRKIK